MTPAELADLRKTMGLKPKADPKAARVMNESAHQMALFRWAEYAHATHPELRWLHSIPNGGLRSKATAGKMKGEGQKPGVCDLFLDVARHGMHGLRIELKTPRVQGIPGATKTVVAGSLSPEQKEWLAHYRTEGYETHVAYGWVEAQEIILRYLKP